MVHTPSFETRPAVLKVFTLMARVVGVVFLIGGTLFFLSAFVTTANKPLVLAVAAVLIIGGLGLILAKGPTVADNERWRRRMGLTKPDER